MRFLTIALSICLLAPIAHADGLADEADLQFQVGAEAYRKGDFTTALEHFLASNRLVANRNVMFNIARSYEQLGKFPESYRYYTDALRGEPDTSIVKTVETAIDRISPRVAIVEVNAQPAGAVVFLDRRDLGSVGTTPARLGLNAGSYKIIVEAQGYEPWETQVTVTVGSKTKVEHELVRILGTLEIGGDPGVEVRLDDESGPAACITPCKLEGPPGSHVLHFTARNAAIAPRPVTIEAKRTVKIKPDLVPLTGSILVSADEANALVEIDGEPRGFTPAVIANVPIGKRTVRVSLSGYESIERVVEVRASAQTDLRDIPMIALRQVSAASRTTESVEDAPASVSIITAQELEAFAYPTILEALRGTRGIATTFDSIYGSVAVRGLGQPNDYTNRLLVLSDGMTLNENVLYQPFLHYDGRTDLGDVDRIEVVRGPGSVLYGTGAVSGVINLVMRGKDEPTSVQGGISSYDDAVARGRIAVTVRNKDYGFWTESGPRERAPFQWALGGALARRRGAPSLQAPLKRGGRARVRLVPYLDGDRQGMVEGLHAAVVLHRARDPHSDGLVRIDLRPHREPLSRSPRSHRAQVRAEDRRGRATDARLHQLQLLPPRLLVRRDRRIGRGLRAAVSRDLSDLLERRRSAHPLPDREGHQGLPRR